MRKMSRIPAAIENDPKVVNIDMNIVAGGVGQLERVLLRVVGLEPERLDRGLQERDHLVRLRDAAGVRDEDAAHEPGLAEELLCGSERHEDARAVRRPTGVAHDLPNAHRHEPLARVDAKRVPALAWSASAPSAFR